MEIIKHKFSKSNKNESCLLTFTSYIELCGECYSFALDNNKFTLLTFN